MNARSPADAGPPSRGWAGTTLEGRRGQRREQLIEAGLDLLGTHGAAAVSVRSVCRHARLTDRYFYESFADRGELLLAVYDRVAAQAADALVQAAASGGGEIRALHGRQCRRSCRSLPTIRARGGYCCWNR